MVWDLGMGVLWFGFRVLWFRVKDFFEFRVFWGLWLRVLGGLGFFFGV